MEEKCCALCGRQAPQLTRHHLIPRTTHHRTRTRRQFTRQERQTVILLCRPCHKQLHAILPENELTRNYHTIEAIKTHPQVARFVAWIARQPATTDIPVRRKRS